MQRNHRLFNDESTKSLYDNDDPYENNGVDGDMTSTMDALTPKDIENAKHGFFEAIQSGNDSLAIYLEDGYPELDLLNTVFENGDRCVECLYVVSFHLLTNLNHLS